MDERLYNATLCGQKFKNQWLYQALIFRESALTLQQAFNHMTMPVFMDTQVQNPSIVLSSLACELLLKGMIKSEKIPKGQKGHNLKILFCLLKEETQNEIISKVCVKLNKQKKDKEVEVFEHLLNSIRNNTASTEEQKEEQIQRYTKDYEKAMDKDATVSVVRVNSEVTNLERQIEERKWFGADEFKIELARQQLAFIEWRYAHETRGKSFYPYFMDRFQESILEFC